MQAVSSDTIHQLDIAHTVVLSLHDWLNTAVDLSQESRHVDSDLILHWRFSEYPEMFRISNVRCASNTPEHTL